MKQFLVFFALLALGSAFKPGLRAKFNVGLFPGRNFFFDIPRNVDDAVAHDWTPQERPESPLPSLNMYCYVKYHICGLYDPATKFVAGVQISLPLTDFTNSPFDWEVQGFIPWTPAAADGTRSVTYMTKQLYFISPETLLKSEEERRQAAQAEEILTEDAVWATGFNRELIKISKKESDMTENKFTRQACIPWMGRHYYYNMSSTTECTADSLLNWFPLFDGGNIIGMGFMIAGVMPEPSGQRFWFERPTKTAVQAIVPNGPKCLYELAGTNTFTTMHIYFIDKPWTVGCPLW